MIFGYDTSLPYLRKQTIINAASRRVYYLHGFNEPPKTSRATQKLIDTIIFSVIESPTPIDIPICKPRTSSKKTKIQHIENDHPRFLHKAYRYATRTIGIKASYNDLARVMTHKLKNLLPLVDTDKINLKPHNVREFFKTFRGRLKRESYKPRLRPIGRQTKKYIFQHRRLAREDTWQKLCSWALLLALFPISYTYSLQERVMIGKTERFILSVCMKKGDEIQVDCSLSLTMLGGTELMPRKRIFWILACGDRCRLLWKDSVSDRDTILKY